MLNSFNRCEFMDSYTIDGVLEYDILQMHWDLFELNREYRYDSIRYGDVRRPDIMCARIYGNSKYWWILCKVNKIDDIWTDMYIGKEIVVPNVQDLEDYYTHVRRRMNGYG